ncbi:MAG: hypothetical protein RL616_320 [Verrucomicrobiota bacterium]
MKSYEVLRCLFKKVGCKKIAAELMLSLSLIHQWAQGTVRNPLEVVARLMDFPGGQALLDWLCRRKGGYFVRELPLKVWRKLTLVKAVAVVMVSASRFMMLLGQAELAGKVSPELAAKLDAAWQELLTEGGSFMAALKQGAFRCWAVYYPLLTWTATGDVPELVMAEA